MTLGIRNKIFFSIILGILAVTCILIHTAQADTATINTGVANVRSGPGTGNEIVGSIYQGTEVEIVDYSGEWYKIRLGNLNGWMSAALLDVKTQNITVTGETVNLRSGPGTNFDIVGQARKGDKLGLISAEGDWYKVKTSNGKSAYIAASLAGKDGPASPAVPAIPPPSPPAVSPGTSATDVRTPAVYINGRQLNFDVAPVIENDRVLVPLRAIFEALGAEVEWNANTQTVTAVRGPTTVVLTIGSLQPVVNGQIWPLDVPGKIMQDRTLAPLRFVGEAFGGQVGWDASTYTVNIETPPDNLSPTSLTVSNGSVNLRSGPASSYDTVEILGIGERLAILGEKDGWYQVSRSGRTGWIAGWVVDVAWEENEPVEEGPVITPEPPLEPVKPEKPGEDVVWLSSRIDDEGLHIIMESGSELNSQVEKKYPGLIYTFEDKQIEGLYLLKKDFAPGAVRADAKNKGDDLVIEITLPSGVKYDTEISDDGKKETITLYNYIISVERKTFGNTGERLVINTPLPVVYSSKLKDDLIEVTLENVLLGKARDSYSFSSDLLKKVTFESDAKGNNTVVTIQTENLGKHAFAESGDAAAFTILLIEKSEMKPRKENLVVLDPGHGGNDSGARGSELWEKNVNLDIALKVGDILTKNGVKVEYTRKTDVTVGLEERAMLANDLNAGIFVSIHSNANEQKDKQGTETHFYAPLSTPELYMQRDERKLLAEKIQQQMISKLRRIDRGVKESNFSVLRNTAMPSVLAEVMFISCPEEHALLKQDKYRTLAAEAIAQGILDYLQTK